MAVPLFGFALWRVAIDTAANSLIGLLGWRRAVTVVGASALAVVMPLAWQIGDRPEDRGLYPDGASSDPDTVLPDYTWREAVRSRSFWFLVAGDGCLFSVGLASWLLARGLAGKPSAGFCTTPSSRITVVYGVIVYAIRFKTPSLHR